MTDEQRQRLSALLDGEGGALDQGQAIDEAIADAQLREHWERYAMISRALRGEPVSTAARELAPRVAAALAEAPAPPAALPARPPARGWGHRRPGGGGRRLPRPVLGVALAAGVALVAVVVGPRLGGHLDGAAPAARLAARAPATVIERWRVDQDDLAPLIAVVNAPRLNELLVSHRERSVNNGLTGFMPYATVVGYGGAR